MKTSLNTGATLVILNLVLLVCDARVINDGDGDIKNNGTVSIRDVSSDKSEYSLHTDKSENNGQVIRDRRGYSYEKPFPYPDDYESDTPPPGYKEDSHDYYYPGPVDDVPSEDAPPSDPKPDIKDFPKDEDGYDYAPHPPSSSYDAPEHSAPPSDPKPDIKDFPEDDDGYDYAPHPPSSSYDAPEHSAPPSDPEPDIKDVPKDEDGYSYAPHPPSSSYDAPQHSAPPVEPKPNIKEVPKDEDGLSYAPHPPPSSYDVPQHSVSDYLPPSDDQEEHHEEPQHSAPYPPLGLYDAPPPTPVSLPKPPKELISAPPLVKIHPPSTSYGVPQQYAVANNDHEIDLIPSKALLKIAHDHIIEESKPSPHIGVKIEKALPVFHYELPFPTIDPRIPDKEGPPATKYGVPILTEIKPPSKLYELPHVEHEHAHHETKCPVEAKGPPATLYGVPDVKSISTLAAKQPANAAQDAKPYDLIKSSYGAPLMSVTNKNLAAISAIQELMSLPGTDSNVKFRNIDTKDHTPPKEVPDYVTIPMAQYKVMNVCMQKSLNAAYILNSDDTLTKI